VGFSEKHEFATQKIAVFIVTAVRTSNSYGPIVLPLFVQKILPENVEEREFVKMLFVIIPFINWGVITGSFWLGVRTSGELLGISWLKRKLMSSNEGMLCMKVVDEIKKGKECSTNEKYKESV
jgi:hypothetical protein